MYNKSHPGGRTNGELLLNEDIKKTFLSFWRKEIVLEIYCDDGCVTL